jgi:hypothetical protein
VGRVRLWVSCAAACGMFAIVVAPASALTLGTTTFPGGAAPIGCTPSAFYVQVATDSALQYTVPAGGGQITGWSTNTTGDAAGALMALLVLRPTAGGSYAVVGFDSETLPNPLPAVATFALASPIAVTGGEQLGLYYSSGPLEQCFYTGGAGIPPADTWTAGTPAAAPTAGAIYTPSIGITSGGLINVSAQLAPNDDVSVAGAAVPPSITAAGVGEYLFTVSHSGPGAAPITFTDTVPSGLTILSAVAGSGSCDVSGRAVSCTIDGGATSASVSIVVTAPSAGTFTDAASVSTSLPDPNPANNNATAKLTVNQPAARPCKTIALAGAPLSVAKRVIPALNCTLGKVTKKASKHVRKGNVISTRPGPGKTLVASSAINIVVSEGPPKARKPKK